MKGLMQTMPLLVNGILDHANNWHPEREMVSRLVEDGSLHRTNYAALHKRARQGAQALKKLGVKEGDVVGTLAWNSYRHFEAWYAIAGLGAVYHTLNPRLFADQLAYIINHGGAEVMFVDLTFVPILEKLASQLKNMQHYIVLTDKAHMPQSELRNLHCYEDLLDAENGDCNWVQVDENAACGLCYTSGTTGNPKGVLYSHRSNVLHTLAENSTDIIGLGSCDTVLPVVPMFHANAWGLTFAAPMVGAKVVHPGAQMDGASIYELLDKEKVNFTAAVPTVWLMLLQHLEQHQLKLPYLQSVTIGGSAVPRMMLEKFERDYEVTVKHAWGMTETSPLGSIASLKPGMAEMDFAARVQIKMKQGRPPYLVEMKIVNDAGEKLPHDGKAFGHLLVRGPFVVAQYMKGEGGKILDQDGWFKTGDVATIDEHGFMQITDRSKDVIKSGGEWISSIEIENLAVGHAGVAEAAVIGVAHPKWDERPLLVLVKAPDANPSKEDVLEFLRGKIASWWMPDDVVFVDEIPHTATGKIQKLTLREQFKDYKLPLKEKDAAAQ